MIIRASDCDLPTNNHLVLFANLLRFIMSKGGVLVLYMFNSPLSTLSHPNSIQTLKKNYNDERPNQRIAIPPIIIDMDTDFKIIFILKITTLG